MDRCCWPVGIGLWPMSDVVANVQLGQNLTIWLHSNANFANDTSKVACATMVRTVTRLETYTQCVKVPSVRYGERMFAVRRA